MSLLPGTEVAARGLRWEVVFSQAAGEQELLRLRCLEGYLRGEEMDLLVPFETVEPIAREMAPERAARLASWRVYHQAFVLEQALGPDALLAAQPGQLWRPHRARRRGGHGPDLFFVRKGLMTRYIPRRAGG